MWALWLGVAFGQEIVFEIDDKIAADFGISTTAIEDALNTSIGNELVLYDQTPFLTSMANAAIHTQRGIGVDYASNPQKFVFGFGGGVGGNTNFESQSEALPSAGAAVQLSAMAGLNLGAFDGEEESYTTALDRFTVYVNGLGAKLPAGTGLEAKTLLLGAHLQSKLVPPQEGKLGGWGGIDLTTGFEYTAYTVGVSGEVPVDTKLSGAKLHWTGQGDVSITSSVASVPLELSTNVRLAFLSLFMGGGADFNFGQGASSISIVGPLKVSRDGESKRLGSAGVTWDEDGPVDLMVPRVFGGPQINIFPLKLYMHLNYSFNQSFGFHTGMRFAL